MKSFLLLASFFVFSSLMAAPCAVGFYNSTDGTDDVTPCLPCPLGKYADTPGSLSCTDCLPGTYAAFTGTETCTECPAGYYQDLSGQINCLQCEAGTMAPDSGSDVCIACPAGTNSVAAATGCNILNASDGSGCTAGRIGPMGRSSQHSSYDLLFLIAALAIAVSPLCYVYSRLSMQKRS